MPNLRVDNDVLEWWRARGKGYQSEINAVLRAVMLEQHVHAAMLVQSSPVLWSLEIRAPDVILGVQAQRR